MEKMDEKALLIVSKYAREHLDKTDGSIEFSTFIVWKCKILQNWKFLISTSLHDGRYYGVTFNGDKNEWCRDGCKECENECIGEV